MFAGEKLFVTWVKDGFHIICAIPNEFARKSTFSTVPLVPDLLLDSQNYFHLFNVEGCTVFGILLQVNISLMLLHPKRGPDPSHLFHSRIIASRFLTHQWNQDDLHLQHGFIESGLRAFLTISQPGFPTFPKTRSSIPSPGKGKRSDSLPDSLLRTPCDEAQTLLSPSSKKFSHSMGTKQKDLCSDVFCSIHTSNSHILSEFKDLKRTVNTAL